jgi:DNA-directed RNA polymerase specialized sigma subunit
MPFSFDLIRYASLHGPLFKSTEPTNVKTKLATFAARCIENEILMHLRSLKKTRKDVSLHDPIGADKEEKILEIAKELGISWSYVSRIEERALMKLYHEFYNFIRRRDDMVY